MKAICLSLMGGVMFLTACAGTRPEHLGQPRTHLEPCGESPNCVNSLSQSKAHALAPLATTDLALIKKVVAGLERSKIIVDSESYLYAEFHSRWFGFVDDVEFLVDKKAAVTHLRSASRVGYSDMGVNRRRMEQIRAAVFAHPSAQKWSKE